MVFLFITPPTVVSAVAADKERSNIWLLAFEFNCNERSHFALL